MPKISSSADDEDYRPISITPFPLKVFEEIVAGTLSNFLKGNSLRLTFQFSYRRGQGTSDALLKLSHHLQVALDRSVEGKLVQLDFSAAFDRIRHIGLLYKFRSVGVGGQFLPIVSEFLSDRRQRGRLNGNIG